MAILSIFTALAHLENSYVTSHFSFPGHVSQKLSLQKSP